MNYDKDEIVLSCDSLTKVFYSNSSHDGKLTALNDLSFQLKKGEILGVIGRNGAGKSTLLKILSRIMTPTSGHIEYEGVLTSIIEIGTGFHDDLTGRENVYLSATLLGYKKEEINNVYDDIVEFSGMKEHMDTPVKHYSSGMYLRLAFSVAFHVKIDILLLDEVIAVGDIDFRRKCFNKIRSMKQNGISILMVSHFMEPIISFCDRCMLLVEGELGYLGSPFEAVDKYMANVNSSMNHQIRGNNISESKEQNSNYLIDLSLEKFPHIKITNLTISGSNKENTEIYLDEDILINLYCEKMDNMGSFEIAYKLRNMNDLLLFVDSYGMRNDYFPTDLDKGEYNVECVIPKNLLSRGVYTLGILVSQNGQLIKELESVVRFKIKVPEFNKYDSQIGSLISPKLTWSIKQL